MLYVDPDTYAQSTVGFIGAALAADEPVLVAVPQANLDLIRDHLGPRPGRIRFLDMMRVARAADRGAGWPLRSFLDEYPDRRVRIIHEPLWPGRAPADVPLVIQHEALINRAFADRRATILCPYDADQLDPSILSLATRTHPFVDDGTGRRPCAAYTTPELVVAAFREPVPVSRR